MNDKNILKQQLQEEEVKMQEEVKKILFQQIKRLGKFSDLAIQDLIGDIDIFHDEISIFDKIELLNKMSLTMVEITKTFFNVTTHF